VARQRADPDAHWRAKRRNDARVARCWRRSGLGINVPDLTAAKRYYDQIMPTVGFEQHVTVQDQLAYRPAAGKPGTYVFFYPAAELGGYSRHRVGLQHLAFMVKARSAVHAVHRLVTELGNEVLHEPRDFPQYPPPHFATFWLDPFGLMLEAVCHYHRD
jgi:catechol 2,3-dioxygenase-like lactoylglutathione lyase family enzyme